MARRLPKGHRRPRRVDAEATPEWKGVLRKASVQGEALSIILVGAIGRVAKSDRELGRAYNDSDHKRHVEAVRAVHDELATSPDVIKPAYLVRGARATSPQAGLRVLGNELFAQTIGARDGLRDHTKGEVFEPAGYRREWVQYRREALTRAVHDQAVGRAPLSVEVLWTLYFALRDVCAGVKSELLDWRRTHRSRGARPDKIDDMAAAVRYARACHLGMIRDRAPLQTIQEAYTGNADVEISRETIERWKGRTKRDADFERASDPSAMEPDIIEALMRACGRRYAARRGLHGYKPPR